MKLWEETSSGKYDNFSMFCVGFSICEFSHEGLFSVVLGGAGTKVQVPGEAKAIEGEITVSALDSVVDSLTEADNIMIVPGYGLAVAQAQFAIADIAKKLREDGKNVRFG